MKLKEWIWPELFMVAVALSMAGYIVSQWYRIDMLRSELKLADSTTDAWKEHTRELNAELAKCRGDEQ